MKEEMSEEKKYARKQARKEILKKIGEETPLILTLSTLLAAGFVGSRFAIHHIALCRQKDSLINNYMLTQEYQEDIDKQINEISQMLEKGTISRKEFDEKFGNLMSKDFVEESIGRCGPIEYQTKLESLNSDIKKYSAAYPITLIGGPALTIGVGVASCKIAAAIQERKYR